MIRHMVYDLDGIWNMENPKIRASHYNHTFIYLLNHIIRHFGSQNRKWKKYELRNAKKNWVEHWTIFTIRKPSTNQQRHNTYYNIFNIFLFCFTSLKSNLCAVYIVRSFDGNNSDKVTSHMERSAKGRASTSYKCLLLNIWSVNWDNRVCFIYMHFDA